MDTKARRMSCWDALCLQLRVSVPSFANGLVVANRWFFRRAARGDQDERAMHFLRRMRDKYGDHVWTWFPLRRTLVVFALPSVETLLKSAENAADPTLKVCAISRFAPGSLVISSGDRWRQRRSFNEDALDLERPNRHGDTFAAIAAAEAQRLIGSSRAKLGWSDFSSFARHLSHQVVFGDRKSDDGTAHDLSRMLGWSNLLLRNYRAFHRFYENVSRRLGGAKPRAVSQCLIDEGMSPESANAQSSIRVPGQIAFWLFVVTDALELHVARTLALIAAHPKVQTRLREQIRRAGALTPQTIDGLHYLEACILEQLRLWTPVPLLLRRARDRTAVGASAVVAKNQQIAFFAGFHHRDERVFGESVDRFEPPDPDGDWCYRGNYAFSAHRQRCAGRTLILFLLKATLASLLLRCRFELVGPPIDAERIAYRYDHFAIELRAIADE